MLNAKQILDEELLLLDFTKGKPAQVGYDLSIKSANLVGGLANSRDGIREGKIGKVLVDRTELTTYTPFGTIMLDGVEGWLFYPGSYDITFNEGCKIPENRVAFIKQRSSLYRNGATINSPVFDPGFETQFMGTIMYVHETIFIEKNARVAQIYFHECEAAEKYNGQFMMDRQRTNQ